MAAKCKVLFWDQHYQVKGLVVAFSHGMMQTLISANGDKSVSFPAQLREVNLALKYSRTEIFLIGGYLPEFICFEVFMPHVGKHELKNMLAFELPRRIPYLYSEITSFFRVIPNEDMNGKSKVRIFAVPTRIWNNFIDQVKSADIKFDAYCHPFMAAELSEMVSFAEFPGTVPGYRLFQEEDGLAKMITAPESGKHGEDHTGEVLGKYGLQKKNHQDKRFLSELPEELRLHRCQNSRNSLILLLGIVIVLAGALGYRQWADQDRRIGMILRETKLLDMKLRSQNGKIEKLRVLSQFAKKMDEYARDPSLLSVFETLSGALPLNSWVTSFRYGNGKIALTISVNGDSAELNQKLASLADWSVENQRQQQSERGSEIWYVTLKGK